ncbi:MAG: hypothetical protein HY319_02345 [Armatimonadetes bacterium]|nr:hypothetical protein [Armatimonadota bacterium]
MLEGPGARKEKRPEEAPSLLKLTLARAEIGPEEKARLEQESVRAMSFFGGVRRALVPTHGGPDSAAGFRLLGYLQRDHALEITLLGLTAAGEDASLKESLRKLGDDSGALIKVTRHPEVSTGIVEEAARGYDLLVACGVALLNRMGRRHPGPGGHLPERQPALLAGQRDNRVRWVHPHINQWPRPGSRDPRARLPLLDWSADQVLARHGTEPSLKRDFPRFGKAIGRPASPLDRSFGAPLDLQTFFSPAR